MEPSDQGATDGELHCVHPCLADHAEDIKKALRAIDLMKILDGQVALGNKSNSKNLGEHKVC